MTVQQQRIHRSVDRRHDLLKLLPVQCFVPVTGSRSKQFLRWSHEIVSENVHSHAFVFACFVGDPSPFSVCFARNRP